MAMRNYMPNTAKSKAIKEKENLELATDSVTTTNVNTDRNVNIMEYNNYRKGYKHDYDYTCNFREDRDYKYKRNKDYEDFSFLDDYTTSAISYEESNRRLRLTSPQTKSEYGETHRRDRRDHLRRHSPIADYDYLKPPDSTKKRSKQTNNDVQSVFYQFEIEKDRNKKSERKSRSPRRRDDYENNILEELGEGYDFNKYLEKTRLKDKKAKKYTNDYQRKGNDYQIFSYKEPKLHERVFKSREKNHEKSSFNSEIEIGNIEYPVLAFKDNDAQDKTTNTGVIYLPVMVNNEKHKSQGSTKHKTQAIQPGDIHVFAANLKDKSIFTFAENDKRNEQKLKDQPVSELQTEESVLSRDAKLKEDSNVRTSTETQTEESLIFEQSHPTTQSSDNRGYTTGSTFQKIEETQTDDSLFFQPNRRNTQSYKYAGSILGSIIDRAEFKSKLKDNQSLKRTKKYEPSIKNKKLFAYQIDVDIEPLKKNVFVSPVLKTDPISETNQFEYKEIKDPLHDDYPVTKDYIKVSDNTSQQIRAAMITKITQPTETPARTTMPINLINKAQQNECAINSCSKKIKGSSNTSKKNKHDTTITQTLSPDDYVFVFKEIPETNLNSPTKYNYDNQNHKEGIFKPQHDSKDYEFGKPNSKTGYIENSFGLQSKYAQIFRSTIDKPCKSSKIPYSSRKSSQIDINKKSIVTEGKNRQSEVVPVQSKQEMFEDIREEPQMPKERMSGAKQRHSSLVGRKSQSIIQESRTDRPSFATTINDDINEYQTENESVGRKSKSTKRESRVDNRSVANIRPSEHTNEYQTKNTKSVSRKKQSITESRMDQPTSGTDIIQNANDYQNEKSQHLGKSRTMNLTEPKTQSKSILRTPFFSKRKSAVNKEADTTVEPDNRSLDNLEPRDEQKRYSVDHKSKERKSETRQSRSNDKHSKIKCFSRSKSRTGSKGKAESVGKTTAQPSESEERNNKERKSEIKKQSETKSKSRTRPKSISQVTQKQQKSVQPSSKRSQLSQSKSQQKIPSKTSKTKSKNQLWSFLRHPESKNQSETLSNQSTDMIPFQQRNTKPPSDDSSDVTVQRMNESEPVDEKKKENENLNKEEKPCECVIKYVKQARECSNFFLGTSLHEQIMDILKVI